MDRKQVKFDNLSDELIQGDKKVRVVRKWGHPWMMLYDVQHLTYNQLSDKDLWRIHIRFVIRQSIALLSYFVEQAITPNLA